VYNLDRLCPDPANPVNVPVRTSKSAELRWARIALALFWSLETILAEIDPLRGGRFRKPTSLGWIGKISGCKTNPEEEGSERLHHISFCDRLTR